jgi:fluoroacetyl-CoA thioesterase
MQSTLKPGLTHRLAYTVPENKTVPFTFPESPIIAAMPKVFATGFMIMLMEWACTELLAAHLDPGEGSLGVHVDVSHLAATPPGMTVTVDVECVAVTGPRIEFHVKAHDGVDLIGEGRHERFVVAWDKFNARVAAKARQVGEWRMANGEWRIGMNVRRATDQVLSGPARVAGLNDVGRAVLSAHACFPERGDVRTYFADQAISRFGTGKHCGRSWTGEYAVLYSVPAHLSGFAEGIGNSFAAHAARRAERNGRG